MSITDQNIKDLIVASVGDLNGVVAANIHTIWSLNARYATVYPGLQALYTERDAVKLLMGQVWTQVNAAAAGDFSSSLSDQHRALAVRLADLNAAITQARKDAIAATAGAVGGTITTIEPVAPPFVDGVDASDPRYSGSPYIPTLSRAGGGG